MSIFFEHFLDRDSRSNSPLKNAIFGGFFGAFVAVAQKGRVEVKYELTEENRSPKQWVGRA